MVSDVSRQFAKGNPDWVAGHTGCDLVRAVLAQVGLPDPETQGTGSPPVPCWLLVLFLQILQYLACALLLLQTICNIFHILVVCNAGIILLKPN